MSEDFARLERHDDLQVLSFIEARDHDGDYGPCLVTRCDPGLSITTTEGPYPDDDDGWAMATEALLSKDLAAFVTSAKAVANQFTNGGEGGK